MDNSPYILRRPVLITGETHQALKTESARQARPIKDIAEEAVLIGLGFMSETSELHKLAKKVGDLNPDAGEIGEGMLRQLTNLASRALGEEVAR